MKTKGYHRFYNRIQYIKVDKELIDIILLNKELLADGDFIFKGVSTDRHPSLAGYKNTPHARKLAIAHLKSTLGVSFIKEIYEEVTEYMRYILEQGAKNTKNIKRLIGEHNITLDANFLLSKSETEITKAVIDNVFQKLESEKSTIELLKKIKNKLGLDIDNSVIEKALPYLELRHIYVHSDGKPNKEFLEKYPFFKKNIKGRISLPDDIINDVFAKINDMLLKFDDEVISKGLIDAKEQQG